MELSLDNLKVNMNALNSLGLSTPSKEPEKTPIDDRGQEKECQFDEIRQEEPLFIQRKLRTPVYGLQGTTGLQGNKGVQGNMGGQGMTGTQSPAIVITNRSPLNKNYVEKVIETSDGFVVRTRVGKIGRC